MKKCIVFDVDRTMVDSYMPELLSLQEAIEIVTGRKINEDQLNRLTSLTTSDFFKYLKLSDEEIDLVNKEWDNTFSKYQVKCFPKIKEIIKKLFEKGNTLAIITSRTMKEFHELDKELEDILKYFKVIVTSDVIENPKPGRESIDYLSNKLQVNLEDIIYVGDSEIDKLFSNNCNIEFIPACWDNKVLENEDNACNTPEILMSRINNMIRFERITNDNLELACKIQNEIFPEEDARENFIEQINKDPYRKEMDYKIVYVNDEPIGVTGIYAYYEYPDDAWLGWFGILDKYRNNGYGKATLEKTIELAKKKGYKNFRLYTDEYAKEAHKLYEKLGFVNEQYDRDDDKDEYFIADVYIYSKSLINEKVEPWNNRFLGLKEQGEKENKYLNRSNSMLEKYIEELKPYVIKLFNKDSSGHDISHLIRTMNTALYLQEKEGGDRIIIGISAFLHDVHRIMQNECGSFVSPKESIPKIKNILSNIDLTEDQVNKICYCIEYHEEYNWNGNNVDDINTLILQDADNLDAIGAIGLGRTFCYSALHNVVMYDESIPLNEEDNYSEINSKDPSTIHHCYHKLFKLGDNMNTETAKQLAKERTVFMKEFVKEFLNEWNANY